MSKKIVKQFLDLGDKIEIKIIKGDLNNPIGGQKFEFNVKGEFKNMSNQTSLKSLEKLMLEGFNNINARLDRVDSRLDKVDSRLDVLESDVKDLKSDMKEVKFRLDVLESDVSQLKQNVKDIKSCPTIQKELNSIN